MQSILQSIRKLSLSPFQDRNELQNRHIDEVQRESIIALRWQGKTYLVQWDAGSFAVTCETASTRERDSLVRALCTQQREAARRQPYWASRGNTALNLNGDAAFPGKPDNRIECRHLATHWTGMFLLSKNHKPDYVQLSTVEAIQKHMLRNAHEIHVAVLRKTGPRIVSRAEWGAQVAAQFESMLARRETASALDTRTSAHSMAVGLKIKRVRGRCIYVVLFYDPNRTATHRRARFDDLADVKRLCTDAFDPVLDEAKDDALLMSPLTPKEFEGLLTVTVSPPRGLSTLAGNLPAFGPAAVRLLLETGCIEALNELIPAFRELAPEERYAALYRFPKPSPLYRVMLDGHPSMLARLGELMAGLPDAAIAHILLAPFSNGMTCLHAALLRGRTEMIRPYWLLVRDSLSVDGHVPLMRAPDMAGTEALFFICAEGKADVLDAYVHAVHDVGSSRLATLLRAQACNGRYGVVKAVLNARREVVRTFVRALEQLESPDRAALLDDILAQLRPPLISVRLRHPAVAAALREFPPEIAASPELAPFLP